MRQDLPRGKVRLLSRKESNMTAPYILDEIPLMDDIPSAQRSVYLDIPSLNRDLFTRDFGITIYGSVSPPFWSISTRAYSGSSAYDHWKNSPVAVLTRLFAAIVLRWIGTKSVSSNGWIGKAIVVSGQSSSEIHFLV
jgi:hypothetical protein